MTGRWVKKMTCYITNACSRTNKSLRALLAAEAQRYFPNEIPGI